MIVFDYALSLIIKQRHPSCFEDWSPAILKTTKSANFEMSPESFSSDGAFKFIKKKKNYWIFKPWQFPHYLAQPALVQIVHLYQHQVFTLARKSHKRAELMMIVFYDKHYIFFSPSTYIVL